MTLTLKPDAAEPVAAAFNSSDGKAVDLFPAVMADIESMSTDDSEALILSVGLVPFRLTLAGPVMGEPLLAVPDIKAQLLAGRRVDVGTQAWWADQDPQAAAHWLKPFDAGGIGLSWPGAQEVIAKFLAANLTPDFEIWANGAVFDLGNIASMFTRSGLVKPWRYNAARDFRTVCAYLPKQRDKGDVAIAGAAHNPIHDCIKQIWRLWEHTPAERLSPSNPGAGQ